jgi:predicted acyl esterase
VVVAIGLAFASSAAAAPPSFDARGSTEQVDVTGLPATDDPSDAQVSLIDASDIVVQTRNANFLGGALFRNVAPGTYTVTSGGETSDSLTVTQDPIKANTSAAPPDPDALYDPATNPVKSHGYGYMTMRDGTKLAYTTHPPQDVVNSLPLPSALADAIHSLSLLDPSELNKAPTLVEYSGYGYARPSGPVSGIEALANLMGFTVVDVNMRGTGCSGGAFDFFEPLQSLDGYDVVETVAHQKWVAHGKVGMLGISYGGISQLFTGQTEPPDLAAISPLSVIDQTQTTLYPGGILNTGFAVAWAQERQDEAKPADPNADPNDPRYGGQPYADDVIAAGGTDGATCAANQALHPDANDLMSKIRANDHYVPEVADPLSPITFVNKINVPSFMACQWTDEQTGGHCPTLAEHMTGTAKKWFTYTNGVHTDSLDPETYNKLFDFLSLYVAQQNPATNIFKTVFQQSWPVAMQSIFGIDGPAGGLPPVDASLPPDPIQDPIAHPTIDSAKTAFEALPEIRVLFDNGAGNSSHPGWPYPGFERSFSSFPIPGATARTWYLGPGGALKDGTPADAAADGFTWDAHARPPTDFTGDTASGPGGLWTATPNYQWTQDPPGTAVSYITPALSHDTAVVGAGRVDLWVRSSTPDVDLQATISEVRPDGKETFVQGGWIKAKARALDPAKSTELEPVPSFLQEDFADMPSDQFVPVTIPLYYEGHMYRDGSKIRVRISAPNGDQPIWAFAEATPAGQANVAIGYGGSMPSRLALPVVPGVSAPTGLPPCPGLRGEPCRDYQALENTAADPNSPPDQGNPGSGDQSGNQGTGGSTSRSKCKKRKHRHHRAAASKKKKRCKHRHKHKR